MFLLAFLVAAVVAVPLTGGRLGGLGTLRLRATPLLVVALGLQILVINVLPASTPEALGEAVHLASYAVAGAFVVANRAVPGLWLAALGGGLNLLAIAANGGVMPASPTALATAGLDVAASGFVNSGALVDPALWYLGDVFAIPSGWPLANVFSVGDVLLAAGAALTVHALCGSRLAPRAAARWRDGQDAGPSPAASRAARSMG